MEVTVREAKRAEIKQIIVYFHPTGCALKELVDYEAKSDKAQLTGHPDTILVAESDNGIVGYLHFYTDCWEGYEKNLLSVGIDLSLSSEDFAWVEAKLKEEFDLYEP